MIFIICFFFSKTWPCQIALYRVPVESDQKRQSDSFLMTVSFEYINNENIIRNPPHCTKMYTKGFMLLYKARFLKDKTNIKIV